MLRGTIGCGKAVDEIFNQFNLRESSPLTSIPVSILYKSITGRYRPVKVADGQITASYRFIKNASWDTAPNNKHMEILYLIYETSQTGTYVKLV